MARLREYYAKCFPWDVFRELVTLGGHALCNAEIAFRFVNGRYRRQHSFSTITALKDAVLRDCPQYLEPGAWYPDDRYKAARECGYLASYIPVENLLRIDVDVTDYANPADGGLPAVFKWACGAHAAREPACHRCWDNLLKPGAAILRFCLEKVLGCTWIVFESSGKKGLHVLVLDKWVAKSLSGEPQRKAIARLLQQGPDDPELRKALYEDVIRPELHRFLDMRDSDYPLDLVNMCLMSQGYKEISHEALLDAGVPSVSGAVAAWIKAELSSEQAERVYNAVGRALFWPRIDTRVTSDPRHLLKTVFSVHAATKKIALPLLDVQAYDPRCDAVSLDDAIRDPSILAPHVQFMEKMVDAAEKGH